MGGFFSVSDDFDITISEADAGYKPDLTNTVESVADVILRHKDHVVVITGAGISSHQLPTFRSDNNSGLWEMSAKPALDRWNFYNDPTPSWKLLANIRNMQVSRTLHPSRAHFVIHELLARGFVSHVITQNIDGLHSFASDVDKVTELHGAVADFGICEKCHAKRAVDNLRILETQECPKCSVCGSILKPPVALFGDAIEPEKRRAAFAALTKCDVLLLIGTHCTVDPVLSMTTEAKRSGCTIIEVNLSSTQVSRFVDVSLQGESDVVMVQIAKILMSDVDWDNLDCEQWDRA